MVIQVRILAEIRGIYSVIFKSMRSTNSREKALIRTQMAMEPPRPVFQSKAEFKIQDHMTQSRINEARAGLQLLKKKSKAMTPMTTMTNVYPHSTKEMAQRESTKEIHYRQSSKEIPNQQPLKYIKKSSTLEYTKEQPPKYTKKSSALEYTKEQPPKYTKKNNPPPYVQEQPPKYTKKNTTSLNSIEEAPIAPKKDFYAILEEEMQKENKEKNRQRKQSNEEENFVECTRGCGRVFNPNAIEKHEKICEKVFQSKRKAYNSAARRQPQMSEGEALSVKPMKKTMTKQMPRETVKEKDKTKIPKWKVQSLQWRAGLKGGKGEQLTPQQQKIVQDNSGMVQCKYCLRKFNQKVGERHIPFCEAKSKQMPKLNTSIKKK